MSLYAIPAHDTMRSLPSSGPARMSPESSTKEPSWMAAPLTGKGRDGWHGEPL